jgi:hypothetical protein
MTQKIEVHMPPDSLLSLRQRAAAADQSVSAYVATLVAWHLAEPREIDPRYRPQGSRPAMLGSGRRRKRSPGDRS